MIASARSSGAVSIVNALLGGPGSSVGIELYTEVRIEEEPEGQGMRFPPGGEVPALLSTTLAAATERFHAPPGIGGRILVRTEVPVACGLKSSSAVGTALVRAVARWAGADPPFAEVARIAAEGARRSGQSATGAFDDCLASVGSGIWVTENRADRVLTRLPTPSNLGVVLWIPPGEHPPSSELLGRFVGSRSDAPGDLVLAGRWEEAMEENSRHVEEALGYPPTPREELHRLGAAAVGISGCGPAVAAVAPVASLPGIARALARRPGLHITTRFRNGSPQEGTA
jgi:shikimate kinase